MTIHLNGSWKKSLNYDRCWTSCCDRKMIHLNGQSLKKSLSCARDHCWMNCRDRKMIHLNGQSLKRTQSCAHDHYWMSYPNRHDHRNCGHHVSCLMRMMNGRRCDHRHYCQM